MARSLAFHPDAELEAIRAHDWYLERSPLAAAAFQEALENAGLAILDAPDRWVEYLYGTRRYLLKRFPFAVVYRSTETKIQIIAVAHGSRVQDTGRKGYRIDDRLDDYCRISR